MPVSASRTLHIVPGEALAVRLFAYRPSILRQDPCARNRSRAPHACRRIRLAARLVAIDPLLRPLLAYSRWLIVDLCLVDHRLVVTETTLSAPVATPLGELEARTSIPCSRWLLVISGLLRQRRCRCCRCLLGVTRLGLSIIKKAKQLSRRLPQEPSSTRRHRKRCERRSELAEKSAKPS